jgi:pimeloyl-ACP methyl ester carboxylesterase
MADSQERADPDDAGRKGAAATVRKIASMALKAAILAFALVGAHRLLLDWQWNSKRESVMKIEAEREYDPDLLYHKNGGEPLFLVRGENATTLFFMEGFRTQSPAGMYLDWFRELHETMGVNVVVPVYGLQSAPFDYRNRDWKYQEDMRLATQVYDAYCAALPEGHRVTVCAQSFGALPALAIAAFARRRPDALVLLSPHNSGLDFKASGPIVHWLSKQTEWLQHVLLFSDATAAPGRASAWDIVNEERNLAVAKRGDVNPEDSSRYGRLNEIVAEYAERSLIPKLSGYRIDVVCGDSDLYFSQEGFERFAGLLHAAGNEVTMTRLIESGHMVLLDNGANRVRAIILAALGVPR